MGYTCKVPHESLTDCHSVADRLKSDAPARFQDKRLQIELSTSANSIFTEDREGISVRSSIAWTGSTQPGKLLIVSQNQIESGAYKVNRAEL